MRQTKHSDNVADDGPLKIIHSALRPARAMSGPVPGPAPSPDVVVAIPPRRARRAAAVTTPAQAHHHWAPRTPRRNGGAAPERKWMHISRPARALSGAPSPSPARPLRPRRLPPAPRPPRRRFPLPSSLSPPFLPPRSGAPPLELAFFLSLHTACRSGCNCPPFSGADAVGERGCGRAALRPQAMILGREPGFTERPASQVLHWLQKMMKDACLHANANRHTCCTSKLHTVEAFYTSRRGGRRRTQRDCDLRDTVGEGVGERGPGNTDGVRILARRVALSRRKGPKKIFPGLRPGKNGSVIPPAPSVIGIFSQKMDGFNDAKLQKTFQLRCDNKFSNGTSLSPNMWPQPLIITHHPTMSL